MSDDDMYYMVGWYEGRRQAGLPYPLQPVEETANYMAGWRAGFLSIVFTLR
jgi:hypothetical protein